VLLAAGRAAAQAPAVDDGEALARAHCAGCHLLPEPSALPRAAWRHVLDLMGLYLGYDSGGLLARADPRLRRRFFDLERYPQAPIIDAPAWARLRAHYMGAARQAAPAPSPPGVPTDRFEAQPLDLGVRAPVVSLVAIDPDGAGVVLGEARTGTLYRLDALGRRRGRTPVGGAAVALERRADGEWVTLIGDLAPSNARNGALLRRAEQGGTLRTMARDLYRTTHTLFADLDGDGDLDLVLGAGYPDVDPARARALPAALLLRNVTRAP